MRENLRSMDTNKGHRYDKNTDTTPAIAYKIGHRDMATYH